MSLLKLNRLINSPLKYYSLNFLSVSSSKLLNVKAQAFKIRIENYSSDNKWNEFIEKEKLYGKLVYKSTLQKQLFMAKTLSLSSSAIGIGMLPFLASALKEASLLANILVFGTSLFFILATPVLFQYVTRRHINRMHYNSETDTFTVYLYNFFLREYNLQFKTSDIVIPDVPGVFTSFQIKNLNRHLFINFDEINDRSLIVKMLGYDKPLQVNKSKEDDDDDD